MCIHVEEYSILFVYLCIYLFSLAYACVCAFPNYVLCFCYEKTYFVTCYQMFH